MIQSPSSHSMRFLATRLLILTVALLGCASITLADDHVRKEATRELSERAGSADLVVANSHNGSITVIGGGGDRVKVVARIKTRAHSDADAEDLLERTRVTLRREGSRLVVRVDRAKTGNNQSVSVDLDIEVPARMGCEVGSHNGGVTVSNVSRVSGETHNGAMRATGVGGAVSFTSRNGSIRCADVAGPIQLETHNGSVTVQLRDDSAPNCKIVTRNGKIDLDAPETLSARVSIRARNGNITTDIPVMVQGELKKGRLEGVIGDGEGLLTLETHNGSIRIR